MGGHFGRGGHYGSRHSVSSNMVQQIDKLEKRVRELENEMTKKTGETEDTACIETELSDLKAKIRQVTSEHTQCLKVASP